MKAAVTRYCESQAGTYPCLDNTLVSVHSLFPVKSISASSKMSMAKALSRLLTQAFRRYLSTKSPLKGRFFHIQGLSHMA